MICRPRSRRSTDRWTPLERLHACAFDNVCAAVRRSVWTTHPFARDANRRRSRLGARRSPCRPCARLRSGRRCRTFAQSKRVVRAEAHLGSASGAASALRRQDHSVASPSRLASIASTTHLPSSVASGRRTRVRLSKSHSWARAGPRLATRSIPRWPDRGVGRPDWRPGGRVMRILAGRARISAGGTRGHGNVQSRARDAGFAIDMATRSPC